MRSVAVNADTLNCGFFPASRPFLAGIWKRLPDAGLPGYWLPARGMVERSPLCENSFLDDD
jgi:hypothetical protein